MKTQTNGCIKIGKGNRNRFCLINWTGDLRETSRDHVIIKMCAPVSVCVHAVKVAQLQKVLQKRLVKGVTCKLRAEEVNDVKDMTKARVGGMELDEAEGRASVKALENKELSMFKTLKSRIFGEAAGEAQLRAICGTGFNFNSKMLYRKPLQNLKGFHVIS